MRTADGWWLRGWGSVWDTRTSGHCTRVRPIPYTQVEKARSGTKYPPRERDILARYLGGVR